jgi:hypothetical protein
MNRLEQWKQDVKDGKRSAMSEDEMHEQAQYRSKRFNAGRLPMSFERRGVCAADISRKKARDKIERLQMIKELAEL